MPGEEKELMVLGIGSIITFEHRELEREEALETAASFDLDPTFSGCGISPSKWDEAEL